MFERNASAPRLTAEPVISYTTQSSATRWIHWPSCIAMPAAISSRNDGDWNAANRLVVSGGPSAMASGPVGVAVMAGA